MRKICLILSVLVLLPYSLRAYDFQSGHLFYTIVGDQAVEVSYEHPEEVQLYRRLRKLTVPAQVSHEDRTYQVIGIGKRAFHDCPKLRRIRLPQSLNYIDSAALAELSSLDSIVLPEGLRRIGDEAFYRCTELSYIDLPASLDSLGEHVFLYCTKLRRLTVHADNRRYDSRQDCNGVVDKSTGRLLATCTRTTIPDTLQVIGSQAFAYRSNIEQAFIPEGVHTIEDAAFAGCLMLDSVLLPATLNSLGEWAFYGCQSLRSVNLPEGLKTIPYNCFGECNDLRHVVLPASVDTLADKAFYFSGLRSIYLNNVQYIGNQCFDGCRFLQAIYVPVGQRKRIQKLFPKSYHKLIIEQ